MTSKKVLRQLSKIFDLDEAQSMAREAADWVSRISADGTPGKGSTPELGNAAEKLLRNFPEFVRWVDEGLQHTEERLEMAKRSLELSSDELSEKNRAIQAMVNSLGEGYVVFGKDGICLPTYSRISEQLFGLIPAGKDIAELLRVPTEKRDKFKGWVQLLFSEPVDFEDLADLWPRRLPEQGDRFINLTFKPIRPAGTSVESIVVIATDITRERAAETEAKRNREHSEMILRIAKSRNQFLGLIQDLRAFSDKLASLAESVPFTADHLKEVFRFVHTAKGSSASFSLGEIRDYCHEFEEQLAPLKRPNASAPASCVPKVLEFAQALRSKVDLVLKMHEDLLGKDSEALGKVREVPTALLTGFLGLLSRPHTPEQARNYLLDRIMAVPIHKILLEFDMTVQVAAGRLDKRMNRLQVTGEDFTVFPEAYEELFNSLGHIFRNAVDHGIEEPERRELLGKTAAGTLSIECSKKQIEGLSWIQLLVRDDGNGVPIEKLRERLSRDGKTFPLGAEGDHLALQEIFEPGVTTKDKVTDLSGRGVGLDTVKAAVLRIGGSIEAQSSLGKGTVFTLRFPLLNQHAQNAKQAQLTGLTEDPWHSKSPKF